MTTFQKFNQNQQLYLQSFEENLYLSIFVEKKFLTIKRYNYNLNYCKFKDKYHNFPKKIGSISKKKIIYNNDLFILDHLVLILSLKLNEIIQNSSQNEINSDIINVPHYAFMALHKKWHHHSVLLECEIPKYLHPEIIIRIINMQIQDVTFVDLLRRGLHLISQKSDYISENIKNIFQQYIKNLVYYVLGREFDFFIKTEFFILLNEFKFIYNRKSSFFLKKKYLTPVIQSQSETFKQYLNRLFFIESIEKTFIKKSNYLRYQNKGIFSLYSSIYILQIFKYRCIKFWKNRIGICVLKKKLNLIKFNHNNFFFLGSILRQNQYYQTVAIIFKNKQFVLKSQVLYKSIIIKMPLYHIIQIFTKYGLCTKNGYPISKSSWSTWSDSQIIDRFNEIFFSIFIYYNGCINRKKLSDIHYILSYSCGKTLACKHKTTLRSIWYQYNKKILKINFLEQQNKSYIEKNFHHRNKTLFDKNMTAWNFDYTNYNSIISLLIQ